ncbi:MAG: DNA repair protein RadC [Holosporales bacterium]|jgi:DNA repair protein RadC|nr:DNA repair protein RadC [Holosporales bacterium]
MNRILLRSASTRSRCEGHRKRAKHKLETVGHDNLLDYEIVELMLFLIFKRKDVKQLAKILIERFKTIDGILNATKNQLLSVEGVGPSTVDAIRIIDSVVKSSLKSRIMKRDSIECFDDVVAYCKANMKHLVAEELRVIFLNETNCVIADETLNEGNIDSVTVNPRNIIGRCIDNGAKGIILVHNHPSGDPTPSANDIYTTKRLKEVTRLLEISIVDHIIIGGDRYISFKSLGLLGM